MSVATDLAELEATIAENELDEAAAERLRELLQEGAELPLALEQVLAERDGALPPPELPAAAEEPDGAPSDKQLRELDKENDRHRDKVRTIMGVHVAEWEPCSKCDGIGLEPPGPKPQTHEWFMACPTCQGFGEVYTGSSREGKESRDCPACGGRGYLEALGQGGTPLAEGGTPIGQEPPAPQAPQLEPAAPASSDPPPGLVFGRPAWMGDPNIGA